MVPITIPIMINVLLLYMNNVVTQTVLNFMVDIAVQSQWYSSWYRHGHILTILSRESYLKCEVEDSVIIITTYSRAIPNSLVMRKFDLTNQSSLDQLEQCVREGPDTNNG